MIHYQRRYMHNGEVRYLDMETNYVKLVGMVHESYQAYLKKYIKNWVLFVQAYQKDADPVKYYTGFDIYTLRENLQPWVVDAIQEVEVEGMVQELRQLHKVMNWLERSMVEKLKKHYKRYEFASIPLGGDKEIEACIPEEVLLFKFNSMYLHQMQDYKQMLVVGPLVLTWEKVQSESRYLVSSLNGQGLYQTGWIKAANRFKNPLKRHAVMVEKVKRLALLTDWDMVERGKLSHAQMRQLRKETLVLFKED